MREKQSEVEQFIAEQGLEARPAFRLLDFLAEAGEIASDAVKASAYGEREEDLEVSPDEIGDALFALLALASRLDIGAEQALEESMEKYRRRTAESGSPGSGH